MLGTLRFVLAILVFISHFPNDGLMLNLGVTAVICFYFISGYLMHKSYQRFQTNAVNPVWAFYKDRCIKLFPQYWIVLSLTAISLLVFANSQTYLFEQVHLTAERFLFDAFLVFSNYSVGSSLGTIVPQSFGHPLIMPSPSLALEFHFYLLVPFIFLLSPRVLFFATVCSIGVFVYSVFGQDTWADIDEFGYLHLPSMLFVFLFGYCFYGVEAKLDAWHGRIFALILLFSIGFTLFILPSFTAWHQYTVQSILLGLLVCVPLFVGAVKTQINSDRLRLLDRWLGDLSYPIFLCHVLAIHLTSTWFNLSPDDRIYLYTGSVVSFTLISLVLARMQHTIDQMRIRYRGFSSLRSE